MGSISFSCCWCLLRCLYLVARRLHETSCMYQTFGVTVGLNCSLPTEWTDNVHVWKRFCAQAVCCMLNVSSLDLVYRQIIAKRSKTVFPVSLSHVFIWIVTSGFCQPPLFHTATTMIHCYRMKNRIYRRSAHIEMTVGGGGVASCI